MNVIIEKIEAGLAEARLFAQNAANAAAAEELRVRYLGRNGLFTVLSKEMGQVPPAERKETGLAFNNSRNVIQELIDGLTAKFGDKNAKVEAKLDLTLPGRRPAVGRKHPISIVTDECAAIFRRMGFVVADGPEIEDIFHNFDALNTPKDHPSRDPQDTFYFEDGRILRTQTSPVQIRVMESFEPPVRIVAPGRVFRRDTPDATHGMNFHQIEGLYIDKKVSMADLKSVLLDFAREMYGAEMKIRLRPHFFPFTEPSVEYDFSCIMCGGKGCPVCKHSGYIEIAGAGMVDPAVLANVGYDPEKWSGFAFGLGIERLAMLRYRIPDLRFLYENDVRFLGQFEA